MVLCEDGATSYIVVVCKAEATGPYSVASYAVQTQDGLQLEGLGRAEIENEVSLINFVCLMSIKFVAFF